MSLKMLGPAKELLCVCSTTLIIMEVTSCRRKVNGTRKSVSAGIEITLFMRLKIQLYNINNQKKPL